MLIIDAHEDLAWNAVAFGRDLTRPVTEIRAREGMPPAHGAGVATTSLPALRDGGVQVVFGTLYANRYDATYDPNGFRTPEEAYRQGRAQVAYYQQLHERGEITLIRQLADLDGVLAHQRPQPGLVMLMEGAEMLRTPEDLARYVDEGVRMVGPAWRRTRYAGGTGEPGPLTDLGRELLAEMRHLRVVLDVSHLAEEAFWEALELFDGPVIASHANARALIPTDRQLSNEMLHALAARDAVIGLVCYNAFILPGWTKASGKDAVTLRHLAHHAEQIAGLIGARHLGLGSDLDGSLGREEIPRELDTAADFSRFADALTAVGFSPDDVSGIMGENWLRTLRATLPE